MRKKFIAGNWKMFQNPHETRSFGEELKKYIYGRTTNERIAVCPPAISLEAATEIFNNTAVEVFAQNIHFEREGAFTGEISIPMLKSIGVRGAIVGHSERRSIFSESDELVNKKLKALVEEDMQAILCVGETLEEREQGKAFDIVENQIVRGLEEVILDHMSLVTIAYEPVWAIGTGRTATPEQAEEMCAFIRAAVAKLYGEEISEELIIQYGGSVKPQNAKDILEQENIDGALVGGASLKVAEFMSIIDYKG